MVVLWAQCPWRCRCASLFCILVCAVSDDRTPPVMPFSEMFFGPPILPGIVLCAQRNPSAIWGTAATPEHHGCGSLVWFPVLYFSCVTVVGNWLPKLVEARAAVSVSHSCLSICLRVLGMEPSLAAPAVRPAPAVHRVRHAALDRQRRGSSRLQPAHCGLDVWLQCRWWLVPVQSLTEL